MFIQVFDHDYTEEDEFKVSLFHLLQCNHGSETNQQILNNEELILRAFLTYLFANRPSCNDNYSDCQDNIQRS